MLELLLWMRGVPGETPLGRRTPPLNPQEKSRLARFLRQEEQAGRLIRYNSAGPGGLPPSATR